MRNLTFILALLLLASCSKTGAVVADEPIKIGVIVPLIGPFAPLGTEFQRGVQLAFEEATSQGLSVKVLYEDDIRITPSAVVAAGNKLINVDTVDVGITMIIEESKPVASMFEGAQT
ncbi:MAG: ABC transporter substrate-binding protein, partial [Candidatus Woesearchaeota archaeon]|nr:ABC transporter substrate-binding protein [Candidatus Woesearchaeota archaeon]